MDRVDYLGGLWGHQVEVIAHQTPRMDLPIRLLAGFGKGIQKKKPIGVAIEDRFTAVSSVHRVVNGSRIV